MKVLIVLYYNFTSYVGVLTQNESNEVFSSIQETQEIDSSS